MEYALVCASNVHSIFQEADRERGFSESVAHEGGVPSVKLR